MDTFSWAWSNGVVMGHLPGRTTGESGPKKKKEIGEKANKKKIRMWCGLARGLADLRGADVGPVL